MSYETNFETNYESLQNGASNYESVQNGAYDKLYSQFESLKTSENDNVEKTSISFEMNHKTILFVLLFLFSISSVFTYYVVDKDFYTKDGKFLYKKYIKTCLYLFLGNLAYLSIFYYIIKKLL